jgi:hypothetical protein
VGNIKDQL